MSEVSDILDLAAAYGPEGLTTWTLASPADDLDVVGAVDWGEHIVGAWDEDGSAMETYRELVAPDSAAVPYPFAVLVGADGRIAYVSMDTSPAALEAAVAALLP